MRTTHLSGQQPKGLYSIMDCCGLSLSTYVILVCLFFVFFCVCFFFSEHTSAAFKVKILQINTTNSVSVQTNTGKEYIVSYFFYSVLTLFALSMRTF